ncbi:MAG: sulfite exporter TauE/SafE family protein [Calditrichaceae bacterium]
MTHIALILFVGILVGLMSSTLGLGGGIVIVPALTLYFGFFQQEAIATSLMTIVFVTILNVTRFQIQKQIEWNVVLSIALFSSLSSASAGVLAVFLSEKILITIFALFIFFLAYKTFKIRPAANPGSPAKSQLGASARIGVISGTISGVTGIGGGGITTPLILTNNLADNTKVVPISNAIMLFTTSFGTLAFAFMHHDHASAWQFGYVHIDTALLIFAGAFPAAYFGSYFQHKLSLTLRKIFLGGMLTIIGIRLLLKLLGI